jgi:hypothetical protein
MLLDWAQNSLIVPPDLYNFTILFLLWEAIGIVRRNLFWPENKRMIAASSGGGRPVDDGP